MPPRLISVPMGVTRFKPFLSSDGAVSALQVLVGEERHRSGLGLEKFHFDLGSGCSHANDVCWVFTFLGLWAQYPRV